ncbi:MAG: hypothetical protein KKG54_00915 [Alphaproteobacteria bacterium]|nr:hypothetical protein [Alphaproteobacteria bacterium]
MAKRPTTAKKSVSAANLAALGADRLADLLMEAGAADAALKRRLRMELAAEVGAADLAFEIDKRLVALGGSRARVSWRKRPALLNDLRSLLRIVVDRLCALDSRLALDRLVAWFDLYPGLAARVSDAKGELPLLFDAATAELAAVASAAGPDVAGPVLGDALSTRLDPWASWIGRGSAGLDPAVARCLLAGLPQGPRPTGRLALVVRKLADRAGDLDAWIRSIPDEDARKPEIGAGIARRLALAGRAGEGRAALEASRVDSAAKARWGRSADAGAPSDAWSAAEIAVLEAEGRLPEADEARWARFARTLSADDLRVLIARLPDFEDVEALDRAFEMAATHPDAMRGLAFLMAWPALREAAALAVDRAGEIRGGHDDLPLWVGRLVGRHPLAALILVRARARALLMLGPDVAGEVQALVSEAEAIWSTLGEDASATDHETFAAGLQSEARRRRVW